VSISMKLFECRKIKSKFYLFVVVFSVVFIISCVGMPVKKRHVARGEENLQKLKYQEAVMDFRAALDLDPSFAEAHWGLARAYESLGRFSETIDELRQVVALAPNNLEAKAKLGNHFLLSNPPDFAEAQKIADEILLADSRFVEGHILRASLLAAQNKPENQVVEVLNHAISLDPNRIESYLSLARYYTRQEKAAAAEEVIQKAISINSGSPLGYIEYGRFLTFTNRPNEATEQFTRAIEVAPKNLEARESLAGFYLSERAFDKAERAYVELAASQDNSPETLTMLADFYSLVGREEDAVKVFEGILVQNPDFLGARYGLGKIYLERREFEKVEQQVGELLKINETDADAHLLRARMNLLNDRADEAVMSLEKILKREPGNQAALYYMAQARLALGQIDQARAFIGDLEKYHPRYLYSRLLKIEASFLAGEPEQAFHQSNALLLALRSEVPSSDISIQKLEELRIRALVARGNANLELRKFQLANEDFREVIRRSPGSSNAYASLARSMTASGDLSQALTLYERALALDPKNFDAITGLIIALKNQKDFIAAHNRIASAIENSKSNSGEIAALYFLNANVFVAEKNLTAAENELQAAIAADANYLPAYSAYAELMYKQNKIDEAISQYNKIIERKPSAPIYTLIGILEDARNNFVESEKNYRRALELTPEISIAANNLAWNIADRETGNLDEAMQFAHSAADRNPKVAGYLDTLGWVYFKKGLYAPAIEHLRKAVALDDRESSRLGRPSNPAYRLRLAMILATSGDRLNARREVESALINQAALSADEIRSARTLLESL